MGERRHLETSKCFRLMVIFESSSNNKKRGAYYMCVFFFCLLRYYPIYVWSLCVAWMLGNLNTQKRNCNWHIYWDCKSNSSTRENGSACFLWLNKIYTFFGNTFSTMLSANTRQFQYDLYSWQSYTSIDLWKPQEEKKAHTAPNLNWMENTYSRLLVSICAYFIHAITWHQ